MVNRHMPGPVLKVDRRLGAEAPGADALRGGGDLTDHLRWRPAAGGPAEAIVVNSSAWLG